MTLTDTDFHSTGISSSRPALCCSTKVHSMRCPNFASPVCAKRSRTNGTSSRTLSARSWTSCGARPTFSVKALPSYLALIPLVYIRHHFPNAWASAANVENFLVRTLLAGAFSGQSDRILDALVKRFRELERFDADEGFAIIRSQNRSLEITNDRFFEMGYGSKNIHLILNLWYPVFRHVPAYDNNLPQVDHIFPQSRLKAIKVTNPGTGRPVMLYRDDARNQLANCMLLTRAENGAGGKGDIAPEEWFAGKSSDYLKLHLIPEDPVLWKMDRYDDFIAARKALIADKFAQLLV